MPWSAGCGGVPLERVSRVSGPGFTPVSGQRAVVLPNKSRTGVCDGATDAHCAATGRNDRRGMNRTVPRLRGEAFLIFWGRSAVVFVLVVAVLDWVGWATGVEQLTRIVSTWPQMTPWTAVWVAGLGVSVLVQSCPSVPGRMWAGRGLAAVVGLSAIAILVEYLTGQEFGIDRLWFGDAVEELQASWPGRPSPQTALATLFLSASVMLTQTNRTAGRALWTVCMLAGLAMPGVAVLSYIFDAASLVAVAESTGMAIATAVCLALVGVAALLLRPDGAPRAWLLSRPDRASVVRLGVVIASFPILVGLAWRVLLSLGVGEREGLILSTTVGTVIVGTVAVSYTRRIGDLAARLQEQTDQLAVELQSAASYMASIMPADLDGPVSASSCYLPSRELGGDCFDYHWIGEDHLVVYLIDVSGHGIEPALLAVSAHNLLRSGSIATETLLEPEAVLGELNTLFHMEQHNDRYFTIWYGVYDAAARTFRYASAGSPPALAFDVSGGHTAEVELVTPAVPVGMFDDTTYTSASLPVRPGCRVLIYSDGASELELADGRQLSPSGFKQRIAEIARSPEWSLETLVARLLAETRTGVFEDDCSMVLLTFH